MKAKEVLDDELRKARLGPLYRPNAALRELVDAFLAQYRGAPSTKDRRRYYLAKATAEFGSNTLDSLTALDVARWRAALPETTRHGSHRALRQVSAAAVKWQWIERNVATDVSNPLHERVELRPVESWEEIEALAHELGPFGGPTAPALPRPAPLVPQSRDPGVRPRLVKAFLGHAQITTTKRYLHARAAARRRGADDEGVGRERRRDASATDRALSGSCQRRLRGDLHVGGRQMRRLRDRLAL